MRKSFFKKAFSYVEPTQIYLGADAAGRERFFQEEDFHFFGQENIFSPLVADLKDIEELGFETEDGSSLKGALIAISGDNLGSHCIGGFTENFVRSKDTFQKQPEKVGPKRTIENYRESVEQLSGDRAMVNVIKFD
ncbi:hypothetical protein N1851_002197 [Merluccius polli]|uniref:Uncharacterized protein n=1 Tax=Merluccius polli TaxID=89951 RepID=A0AA47NAR4_MERPO|nr:hypothetical protein N1851_002197 [Merluccius polli]